MSHQGLSLLFITDDLALALVICDQVVVTYAGRPMAAQSAAELFEAPAHPYAAALVNSRPRLDRKVERLHVVPGRPGSTRQTTTGCPFRERCSDAIAACEQVTPSLLELEPGTLSSFIRADELRGQMKQSVHLGNRAYELCRAGRGVVEDVPLPSQAVGSQQRRPRRARYLVDGWPG